MSEDDAMLPLVVIEVKKAFLYRNVRRRRGELLLIGLRAAKHLVEHNKARRRVTSGYDAAGSRRP